MKNNAPHQQAGYQLRMLILVPELLAQILRVYFGIEPLGVSNNYFLNMIVNNLIAALGAYTDIILTIYCRDVQIAFEASRTKQKTQPFLVKYPYGWLGLVLLGLILVILDQTILNFSLFKMSVDTINTGIFYLIVYVSCSTILLSVRNKMSIEVQIVRQNVKNTTPKFAAASTTAGDNKKTKKNKNTATPSTRPERNIRRAVRNVVDSVLRMRLLMICSAIGRVVLIASLFCIGLNFHVTSTLNYGIILVLVHISSLFSSTMQILIAAEMSAGMLFNKVGGNKKKRNRFRKTASREEDKTTRDVINPLSVNNTR